MHNHRLGLMASHTLCLCEHNEVGQEMTQRHPFCDVTTLSSKLNTRTQYPLLATLPAAQHKPCAVFPTSSAMAMILARGVASPRIKAGAVKTKGADFILVKATLAPTHLREANL